MSGLLFIQICGLILLFSLPILGLSVLAGILAVKNNWSLKLALGVPFGIGMSAIFFVVWMIEPEPLMLIGGFVVGFISLFSYYSFPPLVIDNLNILFTRLAHINPRKE